MTHVRQKHPYGCGPACLSMLTGVAYDQIVAELGGEEKVTTGRGITHHDCDWWLAEQGYATSRMWRARVNNARRDPWPPAPWADAHLIMVEISKEIGGTHFVVWLRGGKVLDPARDQPSRLEDYAAICQIAGVHRFR